MKWNWRPLSLKSWHFETSEDIMMKFKSQALYIKRNKYCNAGWSGNPPFLISALWNIGILLHKQATSNKHFHGECITKVTLHITWEKNSSKWTDNHNELLTQWRLILPIFLIWITSNYLWASEVFKNQSLKVTYFHPPIHQNRDVFRALRT